MLIILSVLLSLTGLFLASLLIIITGLSVCCWCRKGKQKQVTSDDPTNMAPVIYEEILPSASREIDMELNQNVAYGPIIRPQISNFM